MTLSAASRQLNYEAAAQDFQRMRRQALEQQLWATLAGKPADLLSYEAVCEQLEVVGSGAPRLEEIPLDSIRGSVGRWQDFTADFLPKKDSSQERWVGVKAAVLNMVGLPPIEVYAIDGVYFVQDGNHRVSVARQLGVETISAYVTPVHTKRPLSQLSSRQAPPPAWKAVARWLRSWLGGKAPRRHAIK